MGWGWTWWIFSARMWAIARRPTTKTRCAALWIFWGRGWLTQEPDTKSKFAPEMDGWNTIVTIVSFWGKWPIFRGYVSFRELCLHLVWKKSLVHRPFCRLWKTWWIFLFMSLTKKVLNLFVPGCYVPEHSFAPSFWSCGEADRSLNKKTPFIDALSWNLNKKRCEIWWVLIPCSGAAFWRFQFGNGKTRLLLGMFRREGQWSPGPKNGSTNKIHHVCVFFWHPHFWASLQFVSL